jgi:adenylyltransferase/sulfurtransferase
MGTIQATEVLKLILGIGEPLIVRLLLFNALGMQMKEVHLLKDPECPICCENPTIYDLIDYEQFCGVTLGREEPLGEKLGVEWEISPKELKIQLDSNDPLFLIDVRKPHEWEICHLLNAKLIPENDLLNRINELDSSDEIVLYCRTGVRSARVLKTLREAGYKKLKNLVGGIHGWADDVDNTMPVY